MGIWETILQGQTFCVIACLKEYISWLNVVVEFDNMQLIIATKKSYCETTIDTMQKIVKKLFSENIMMDFLLISVGQHLVRQT